MHPTYRAVSMALLVSMMAGMALADVPSADEVRRATSVEAGLAVVLGSADGTLEADLAAHGRTLVQTLTTDAAACAKAREHLFAQGVYGQASVDYVASVKTLPYYNMLVNLLIADCDALGEDRPAMKEIMRVLGYGGIAYLKIDGKWEAHQRPMPDNVGEFSHYLYDATRSNMSPDGLCGPPNALRWVGKPSDNNGWVGVRVKNGVAIFRSGSGAGNKSPEGKLNLPDIVVAKDAYSGVTLWSKIMSKQANGISRRSEWGVIGRECLFLYTMGTASKALHDDKYWEVAIEAWDLRTGDTRHRFVLTEKADKENPAHSYYSHGTLAVSDGRFVWNYGPKLIARDELSGKTQWEVDLSKEGIDITCIMIADGLVIARTQKSGLPAGMTGPAANHYVAPFTGLIAWSLADGKEVWRLRVDDFCRPAGFDVGGGVIGNDLTGYRDGLLPYALFTMEDRKRGIRRGGVMSLIDVKTGKLKWATKTDNLSIRSFTPSFRGFTGMAAIYDNYIMNGRVHIANLTRFIATFDLNAGKELTGNNVQGGGRSSNCCTGTATTRYLMLQRNWMPWSDVAEKPEPVDLWYSKLFSLTCKSKATPAYGSTYLMCGSCNCTTFLPGSFVLYGLQDTDAIADNLRTHNSYPGSIKGPLARQDKAYESTVAFDWKLREGRTAMTWSAPRAGGFSVSHRARGSSECWGYGQPETEAIQVGDLLIKGYVDEHRIEATRNGESVWNFVAGGRIGFRGPIQADDRRIYFGSHDGHIYAVNHADGSLAWRVLAAPADRRMVAFGQVESSWPLFNVVLHEGKVYGCAGRHHELDGGLHFYAIDASTGKIDWHVRRRIGMADADNEGAIHGAWQGKSRRWKNASGRPWEDKIGDFTYSSQWALNSQLSIKNGRLLVNDESAEPLEIDLANPEDVLLNEHTFTPPDARKTE